ncbi:MAG TPA: Fur family transcriptional regulator [Miltoncostaeaceae bacterium]|nr:Fur family transcriptional regulator [Miltoncostaeaceae bacterium]
MPEPLRDVVELLRSHGLRATAPRIAVLDAIVGMGHPDADAVRAEVTRRIGSVSTQAVYDTLHALTDAGLLRRIEPAGHPARYETRVGDNHHHLICRACGTTRDVDCAAGHAPCLEPSAHGGFVVDEAEVIYWGLCADCAAVASRTTTSTEGTT